MNLNKKKKIDASIQNHMNKWQMIKKAITVHACAHVPWPTGSEVYKYVMFCTYLFTLHPVGHGTWAQTRVSIRYSFWQNNFQTQWLNCWEMAPPSG